MIHVAHLALALVTAAPATGLTKELDGYQAFKFGMDRAAVARLAAITCASEGVDARGRRDEVECRAVGATIVSTPSELLLFFYKGRLYNVIVRLRFSPREGPSARRAKYLELMELLKHKYGQPNEEDRNPGGGTPGVGEGATWWGPSKRSRLWTLAFTDDSGMWARVGYTDQSTLDAIEAGERELETDRKAARAKDL